MTNKSPSELEFEQTVIRSLADNGWTYRPDLSNTTEEKLLTHWREILNQRNIERLGNEPLTDNEFEQAKSQIFAVKTPLDGAKLLKSGQLLVACDAPSRKGKELILEFFWQADIAGGKNSYEVVNQITRKKNRATGKDHRFDVSLLISGIPVIHLELKREDVSIDQAYWQIRDYLAQGDFGGFYSLVQIFAILNGDQSRYFARPANKDAFNPAFCFSWADKDNQKINESSQFIKYALRVPMGHKLMSRYTISDRPKGILKVLRSYQIYAVEEILFKLNKSRFNGGERDILGGYVWHTTGSGKTMTSFKTAQLASELPNVDKVVFLADRNELVKQTVTEYSGFVDDESDITATKNSSKLLTALLNPSQKLIVTSIQKMDNVAKKFGQQTKLKNTHIVFIVDEAHRSTAGEMLINIRKHYPNAVWFGFTGTPILDELNKETNTAHLFGDPLHIYSIADGIFDENVLGFDVRQNFPISKATLRDKVAEWIDPSFGDNYHFYQDPKKISDLEIEKMLSKSFYEKDQWYEQVTKHILQNWQKNSYNRRFSAMLAVSDIKSANRYFNLLKDNELGLKIAVIYDPNGDYNEGSFEDTSDLENAMIHYNQQFNKEFGLETVPQYKEDLMNRLARREEYKKISTDKPEEQLDLVIVVWQLLTGFDAPYLKTLYLDKVLDYANLIQAFSRTNRILDKHKPFGTVEYYRSPIQMAQNVENALKLYSNKKAEGVFFVSTKKENLAEINRTFNEITALFETNPKTGEVNFAQLPQDEAEQKQFARSFNQLEKIMIALRQQGFDWENAKERKKLEFTHEQYLTLQARYADLDKINRDPSSPKPKFEIDPMLISGDRIQIDKDYLAKLLNDLAEADEKQMQSIEQKIRPLFDQLRENDRHIAGLILADVKSGKLKRIDNFQVLLEQYRFEIEQNTISDFVALFGLNRDLFNKLQAHHVLGKEDWRDFGLITDLINSADFTLVENRFLSEDPNTPTDRIMLEYLLEERIKQEIERVILNR